MKKTIILFAIIILFSCKTEHKQTDSLNLENKLSGKWKAKAFDGELHEKWNLNNDGWMIQQGYYIVGRDTSYSAKTKIEKIGNEIILLSVIKNSNPKIFKVVLHEKDKIVFKNDDYKNPYEVTYEFLSITEYRRTIRGMENDSLVVYEFNFEKIE